VRRARLFVFGTLGIAMVACGPWVGWWTLALVACAGLWMVLLDAGLRRARCPERWAMASLLFNIVLLATGVALSGGPDSPLMPFIMIPVSIAPMRFRGSVVFAVAGTAVLALLVVTVGVDPAGAGDNPAPIIATIALLVSLTSTTWALAAGELKQRDAAVIDPLTGLLNRKALELRAVELEAQASITGGSVAFVACDIDGFKQVNDLYGHDRGDAVLKEIAYYMRKDLRNFELIYRLGGEEFLIVLTEVELEEGIEIAERLRASLQKARPDGLDLTLSFGVSSASGTDVVYERLFKAADEALYEAKAAGRNCVVPPPAAAEPTPIAEPVMAPLG